jgi:hypothetical protein
MTTIRRIAHTPREAQCIARLLLMQVILVCVAHAAQRAWMKGRAAGGDAGADVIIPRRNPASSMPLTFYRITSHVNILHMKLNFILEKNNDFSY